MTYPRTLAHIGLSVPNLDKALKFYNEVMGWYIIKEPETIENTDSEDCLMARDVFGEKWSKFKVAHMSTGDGIGIEIFEFSDNKPTTDSFSYSKTGLFHFCIKDPDLEELIKKIVESGGKQRMPVRYFNKGKNSYRMCFVEDPFGIVFEIYSHSYELINS
ncbi:MAG: VOC family protein [Actinomycetota bacterium]|jgi:lactoylglutathione lyase family protein|nr:VOC family protein [Actinomycetota bacterium]